MKKFVKNWQAKTLMLAAGALLMTACVDKSTDSAASKTGVDSFDFTAMLANYADNIIVPTYSNFSLQAELLTGSSGVIENYCTAIGSAEESAALQEAQQAWRDAMAAWQHAELVILGPLTANGGVLKNRIFAYDDNLSLSSCALDDSVALAAENAEFDVSVRSSNSKGLGALEYLLFNEQLDHTCPSQIVSTQTWNARSDEERKSLRCAYASLLADDIVDAANSLLDEWSSESGNYRTVFLNPANTGSQVNALSDVLFYVESEVKDHKLGRALGLHSSCSQAACPATVESPYSQNSLSNIRNNLEAFRALLLGGTGLGFDDLIAAQGVEGIIKDFETNITAAIAVIDGTDESIIQEADAIVAEDSNVACVNSSANPSATADSVDACRVHGYLKNITDILRADFVTAINVDIPQRVSGDTD